MTRVAAYRGQALAMEVGERLRGGDVASVLNRLVYLRGAPTALYVDNGAEFTGQIVDLWAYHHKVRMDFSRPGMPTDNAHIESFNGSLRDECLNLNWFVSAADAKTRIEAWRREYNESRPHMALSGMSPIEFARKAGSCEEGTRLMAVGN